jgi:hypothetical protein
MGSIVNAIGGIFGSHDQKHAAKNTITTYDTVGRQATDQFEKARQSAYELNSPFYDVGRFGAQGAAGMLQPGAQFNTSDPSYNWRLQQGLGAVENSAAANGLLHSGGTLKALNNYAQGAASQEFQNQFNRLNSLGQYGTNAANTLTNANYNSAQGIGNSLFNMARGVTGGFQDKANALNAETGSWVNLGNGIANAVAGGMGGNPFAGGANPFAGVSASDFGGGYNFTGF